MPERDHQEDEKTIPPGRRSGTGSASVVPFLVKSLATKPQVPVQPEDQDALDASEDESAS